MDNKNIQNRSASTKEKMSMYGMKKEEEKKENEEKKEGCENEEKKKGSEKKEKKENGDRRIKLYTVEELQKEEESIDLVSQLLQME